MVLPEPVWPTSATDCSGIHCERNVLQHPVLILVGEPDILKFDVSRWARPALKDLLGGSMAIGRSSVLKMRCDATTAACSTLYLSEMSRDRLEEKSRILNERYQGPSVSAAVA